MNKKKKEKNTVYFIKLSYFMFCFLLIYYKMFNLKTIVKFSNISNIM